MEFELIAYPNPNWKPGDKWNFSTWNDVNFKLDGHDISREIIVVDVHIAAGGVVETTLKFVTKPNIKGDGKIYFKIDNKKYEITTIEVVDAAPEENNS